MKVWGLPSVQSVRSWEDLRRFVAQPLTNFSQILTRGIGFTDNINCQIIDVRIGSGAETKINHDLGVIPVGYLIMKQDEFALVKTGTTAWSETSIYLTADSSTNFRIAIIGS